MGKGYLLNKFENKYIIKGTLKAESPIYIGAGGNDFTPTATDNPLIRDENGNPFIPGTSLKGVIRSFMERLLSDGLIDEFEACNILSDNKEGKCLSMDDIKNIKEDYKKYAKENKCTGIIEGIEDEDEAIAQLIYHNQCDICKLFGGHGFASKIKVSDCRLKGDKAIIQRRDGVSIDRDTLTAMDGRKYDFECVAKGTEFNFEIIVDNIDDNHIYLLKIILKVLKNGELAVGGKTSAGLGYIKLVDEEIFFINKSNMRTYYLEGINDDNKDKFKGGNL